MSARSPTGRDLRSRVRRWAWLLPVLFLTGCSLLPIASDTSGGTPSATAAVSPYFAIEGRFSLRQDERNHSGRLSWSHAPSGDTLLLASPFGQGVAEIVAVHGLATLTASDGRRQSAPDVATLTTEVLGYALPLDRLVDWVRARPAGAEVVERDAQGRPLRLRLEDWSVAYAYDGDGPYAAPTRVDVQRLSVFELRLRIDAWSELPTAAADAQP